MNSQNHFTPTKAIKVKRLPHCFDFWRHAFTKIDDGRPHSIKQGGLYYLLGELINHPSSPPKSTPSVRRNQSVLAPNKNR